MEEHAEITVKHEPNWSAVLDRISHSEERIGGIESRVSTLESNASGIGPKLDDLRLIVKGDYVGGKWQAGLRDQIEQQGRDINETKDLAIAANAKADKFGPRITAGVAGIWAVFLGGLLAFLNAVFQWVDVTHHARIITGGH